MQIRWCGPRPWRGALLVVTGLLLSWPTARADETLMGDVCVNPYLIPNVPFTDSQDSCVFSDDYDAACPSSAFAPDVVYSYTPTLAGRIDISLCDSLYDTKLFVYAGTCPGTLVACSDDDCGVDGYRSQVLNLDVDANEPYFIVVDGYSSDCGTYTLIVTESELPPACLDDSEFSQTVDLVNGTAVVIDAGLSRTGFESFTGVTKPIALLRWWGTNAVFVGGWQSCEKTSERYEVSFYADNAGEPDTDNPLYGPVTVTPAKTATEYEVNGNVLYQYDAFLDTPVPLTDGWVALRGVDDGQGCWALWATAEGGDTLSYVRVDDQPLTEQMLDLTLCLAPSNSVPVGACCAADGACALKTEAACVNGVGDMNCDGNVDFFDIDPFVVALTGEAAYVAQYPNCEYLHADVNNDGVSNFFDIDPFVNVLVGNPIERNWLGPNSTCDQCQ